MVPNIRTSTALFSSYVPLPACPSYNSRINIKISMEHGGVILTGDNRVTHSETCLGATLSTTNLTTVKPQIHQNNIKNVFPTSEITFHLRNDNQPVNAHQ